MIYDISMYDINMYDIKQLAILEVDFHTKQTVLKSVVPSKIMAMKLSDGVSISMALPSPISVQHGSCDHYNRSSILFSKVRSLTYIIF